MALILVYTLSKTILGHSFFNYILVYNLVDTMYPQCEITPFERPFFDVFKWSLKRGTTVTAWVVEPTSTSKIM